MFWECKESFANETWASGWASFPVFDYGDDNDHVHNVLRAIGEDFHYYKEKNPLWQVMVEDFGFEEVCMHVEDVKDDVKAHIILNR